MLWLSSVLIWLLTWVYAKNTMYVPKWNYKEPQETLFNQNESILDLHTYICAVGHFAR